MYIACVVLPLTYPRAHSLISGKIFCNNFGNTSGKNGNAVRLLALTYSNTTVVRTPEKISTPIAATPPAIPPATLPARKSATLPAKTAMPRTCLRIASSRHTSASYQITKNRKSGKNGNTLYALAIVYPAATPRQIPEEIGTRASHTIATTLLATIPATQSAKTAISRARRRHPIENQNTGKNGNNYSGHYSGHLSGHYSGHCSGNDSPHGPIRGMIHLAGRASHPGHFSRSKRRSTHMTMITLYSKAGCHLCDDARGHLEDLAADHEIDIEEIDIRSDLVLFERYRYRIPVILVDGVERLEGRIEQEDVQALLPPAPEPERQSS